MNENHQALTFALDKYPERVEAVPVDELLLDSARGGGSKMAYIKLGVPDEVVKSLRGLPEKRQNLLFLVSIPKEIQERSESPIILPGEV
ncbi:MAG: hypothetical protein AAF560_13550 [Acidobacteriota bacterium]